MQWGGGGPGAGAGETAGTDSPVPLDQVILGEIFSDYTPAQVVVKELRASAGPLEQRKFISEAQPYRYRARLSGRGPWRPQDTGSQLREVTLGSGRSQASGQTWFESWIYFFLAVRLDGQNLPL